MGRVKLKPFDLDAAKRGEPVCTRDGRDVRIICFDRKDKHHPICALIMLEEYSESFEEYETYSLNGKFEHHDSDLDLFMKPKKKKLFIAVHKKDGWGSYPVSRGYESLLDLKQENKYEEHRYQVVEIEIEV